MSKCHYYHCPHPKACECYGWCVGHRASLATWICHHLKPVEKPQEKPVEQPQEQCVKVEPVAEPVVEPVAETQEEEHLVDDNLDLPPSAQVLQSQHVGEQYASEDAIAPLPLLRAESLPYYLDKIEEYNEPQELIEQLAKSQTEYNSKIEAEMEDMRKKLAHYEEQKKIVDEIHQLEEKVKNLQPKEQEKKASQLVPKSLKETMGNPDAQALGHPIQPKRTISIPTTTPRPVGQKTVSRTQKK
jgi:hypothetical protein